MECLLVGKGPSINLLDWSQFEDVTIAAVSGGIWAAPLANYLFAIDAGRFFDKISPDVQVHTHVQNEWDREVIRYEFDNKASEPAFFEGPIASGDMWLKSLTNENPMGLALHSLLFAVQALPRLGYETLYLAGVDLTGIEMTPIRSIMAEWYPLARDAGLEWFNCSPLSHLQGVIPDCFERVPTCRK